MILIITVLARGHSTDHNDKIFCDVEIFKVKVMTKQDWTFVKEQLADSMFNEILTVCVN